MEIRRIAAPRHIDRQTPTDKGICLTVINSAKACAVAFSELLNPVGSAGGEHDACSFQLGLNPYPFDVALRADRVIRKLVWDVQHLAGLH